MRKTFNCGAALLLALIMIFTAAAPAYGDEDGLKATVDKAAAYMVKTVPSPTVASVGGEWAVLGVARSGYEADDGWYAAYYANLEQYAEDCGGVLSTRKYTEYSRAVVAITAIGKDPTDVAGYNLLAPLGIYDNVTAQGINGPIWALIALDSGDYPVPTAPAGAVQADRQKYVDYILSAQNADGGFAVGGGSSDADVTAMAVQALSNYTDQTKVSTAVAAALVYLSSAQSADGGFGNSVESTAQVIVALGEMGVTIDDERFVKDGNSALDKLLTYKRNDGGFAHTATDVQSNQMATEQALYALASALRQAEGKCSLYDMIDAEGYTENIGLAGKNAAVKAVPVTNVDIGFGDVEDSLNREAVVDLASRGIVTGKGDGKFYPNAAISRAEFAAITVRALGMTGAENEKFADVVPGSWYAGYVGTANKYGIVNGVSASVFNPGGSLTREQAAAMVCRAAALCGLGTDMSESEVEKCLAAYPDGDSVSAWARNAVAYCLSSGILDGSSIRATDPALRGEVAQMLFNMLKSAKLI